MRAKFAVWAAVAAVVCLSMPIAPAGAAGFKAVSDKTVTTFKFPETVYYDAHAKVLYVSEFGSVLKPALKDGKGHISKVSLDGKVLDSHFLPGPGQTMDKPKGMWVEGKHLWVTDIDGVWEFDITTKKGRKLPLPGAKFANDTTKIGDTLYVSDNRGDQLFSVHPADFLDGDAKVTAMFKGMKVNPNGIFPSTHGALLLAGFASKDDPRPLFKMKPGGKPKAISKKIGRLDGLYRLSNGTLLATDWDSGSLFTWTAKGGMHKLAHGFKGPADFAVVPESKGMLVVVPDLVKSELRFIKLTK